MSATTNYNLPALSNEGGLSAYLAQIKKFPMLAAEEEYMLAKNWKTTGNIKSAEKLVTSHLRLVAKIAMGYKGYGLPVNEMISEGNVGLMQAVKKFKPEKGFRLATYAMWWIKASIQEYILRSWSLVKIGTTTAQKKLFFNLKKIIKVIHPEVRIKMNKFLIKNRNKKIVVLDIPLLLENKINKKNDILIFVDAKKSQINKRLKRRKNFNLKLFKKFKKIQLPIEYKKKKSQFILKNNFTNKFVKKGVKIILKEIL